MTLRARAMGMAHTTFANASGLPDDRQVTTARDLALLARRLVTDFPSDYRYFSTPNFTFERRVIYNHDMMLKEYPGADGMKTGYTEAAGHNLVTSAVRGGVRLIGVVLGAGSNAARDEHMVALLNQGFGEMGVQTAPPATLVASRGPSLIASAHAATLSETHVAAAKPATAPSGWGIQLGSFAAERTAREVATSAHHAAEAGEVRIERITVRGVPLWRAQVVGLTAARAQDACSTLAHSHTTCVVVRPEPGQIASR
jgi:D-alanyl-D-alanine carboxypeptidase